MRANIIFFLSCFFVCLIVIGIILYSLGFIPIMLGGVASNLAVVVALILAALAIAPFLNVITIANKKLLLFSSAVALSLILGFVVIFVSYKSSTTNKNNTGVRTPITSPSHILTSSPTTQSQIVTPSPISSPIIQNQGVTPSPTLEKVLSVPSPGCGTGANSLQNISDIAQPFRCPSSNEVGYNPYNDFGAKDEAIATADISGQTLTITGTADIKSPDLNCTKECIFQANIFFHKEDTAFRQSTVIGIAVDGCGISIDRSGNVYQMSKGSYNLTLLEQLPNFLSGHDLISNTNPVNLQIIYFPNKNLSFIVTYKGSLPRIFDSGVPSTSVDISSSINNFQIFVQNIVNPANYNYSSQGKDAQKELRDFGNSSLIGLGEVEVDQMV